MSAVDSAPSHGAALLEARDVNRRFGGLKALDGITSVEEVLRVAGIEATMEDASDEEIDTQRKETTPEPPQTE